MALIEWNEGLSVKVEKFDEQHRKLIDLINRLHDAMSRGEGSKVLGRIFVEVLQYTRTHFAAEEALMQEHNYPWLPTHRLEHQELTRKAAALLADFEKGNKVVCLDVLTFLCNWLTHHIKETDKQYGPFLNGKGIA